MNWLKNRIDHIADRIRNMVINDELRSRMMFDWLNVILALVAFVMTVVNIFTREYILMVSTGLFTVLCLLNVILFKRNENRKKVFYVLFSAESLILILFFFITGIPNGFSALWVCLIPSFSMLIFGKRNGAAFSLIAFFMVIFLFWIPYGRSLLLFRYTDEFMLRFPFFYIAIFILALFLEFTRAETQKQLVEAEQRYKYLYCHDALTDIYNRYGFYEAVAEEDEICTGDEVGLLIMDIDDFKMVNDNYGHSAGDEVLRMIGRILKDTLSGLSRFCRWGGEEFTVYFRGEHDYDQIAAKLQKKIHESEVVYDGNVIRVTVSIGLCLAASVDTVTMHDLIKQADDCLYEAKAKGKKCIVSRRIESDPAAHTE